MPPHPGGPQAPYAAPVGPPRAIAGLARALTVLLAVACVTGLLSGLASWRRAGVAQSILDGDDVSAAAADSADLVVAVAAIADVGVTIAIAVVFIVWFWRVIKNSQLLDRAAAPMAGWAIGSWFIPLANLVLPGYFLNKVDRVSGDDDGHRRTKLLIIGWAVAYGAAIYLSRVIWRVEPIGLDELVVADRRDLGLQLVYVVAAVLAILLVRSMTDRQHRALGLVPPA